MESIFTYKDGTTEHQNIKDVRAYCSAQVSAYRKVDVIQLRISDQCAVRRKSDDIVTQLRKSDFKTLENFPFYEEA